MLAQLLEWPRAYAAIAALTRVPLAVPLGFVVALFVMLRYTEQLTAVAAVATYLVAYVMLQRGALLRLLEYAPLVYIGQRSYGAYLLHVLFIHIGYMLFGSTTNVAGLLTFAFTLAVTIPAAEVLYRVVEKPGMDFARRFDPSQGQAESRQGVSSHLVRHDEPRGRRDRGVALHAVAGDAHLAAGDEGEGERIEPQLDGEHALGERLRRVVDRAPAPRPGRRSARNPPPARRNARWRRGSSRRLRARARGCRVRGRRAGGPGGC